MTGTATLIECRTANLIQRNQTQSLLKAIISNRQCDHVFRVSQTPQHIAIVQNHQNPPSNLQLLEVTDSLELLSEFNHLHYQQGTIPVITNKGLKVVPMMDVTHINPKSLPHVLKQERGRQSHQDDTIDPRTWTKLPEIIKDNWKHLSADMHSYVSQCFERYTSSWSPTFSFRHSAMQIQVPVTLPNSFETHDLVMLLIGFKRDPNDKFKRIDPDTGDSFSLDTLRPAGACALRTLRPSMEVRM